MRVVELEGAPSRDNWHPTWEKLYESLLTREEMAIAEDLGKFYRTLDERGQDYSEFFSDGQTDFSDSIDYHSHNAAQLTLEEMKELLKRLGPLEDLQSS